MKFKSIITLLSITVILGINCSAEERVAVKTNLLYDALYNANLGIEFSVAPHWSVDISGNYNGWKLSHGRQWKHWMLQPELRYWLKDKNMRGHFLPVICSEASSIQLLGSFDDRDGLPVLASDMAIHGGSAITGAWRPRSQ